MHTIGVASKRGGFLGPRRSRRWRITGWAEARMAGAESRRSEPETSEPRSLSLSFGRCLRPWRFAGGRWVQSRARGMAGWKVCEGSTHVRTASIARPN
eukprot:1740159-Rhodomonas_salina.5